MGDLDVGKLFSFDGRIGRRTFWQLVLLMFVANLVIYIPFFAFSGSDALQLIVTLVAIVVYLAVAVAGLATAVKRLHDRGRSGWFYLISFIPLIGPIWLLIEVGIREGEQGANEYGEPNSGSPFRGDATVAYGSASTL